MPISAEATAHLHVEWAPNIAWNSRPRSVECAAELSRWRGLAREGRLPLMDDAEIAFATMVVEASEPAADTTTALIEIAVADAVVRVAADCPAARIAQIAAALRAAL